MSMTWHTERLAPPQGRPRVWIDTDAANEIDDSFALAWALLRADALDIVGVAAAPYSFEHRRQEMLRAQALLRAPDPASAFDLALLAQHRARLERFERRGWTLEGIRGWAVFCDPGDGMARSRQEIVQVFDALGLDVAGRVWHGSRGYLADAFTPQPSAAVERLIELALATPEDGAPLYVAALGCVTNIASALLAAPQIARRIVVVWTSGFPSHAPHINFSLNMEQDLHASRVLMQSGVPLVYLPGFHVGAQLRLSLPEMQAHVAPRGAIGAHLHHLYTHNPLTDLAGIEVERPGFSWVIWDLIVIAWLLDADWAPSTLMPTPTIDGERRWVPRAGAPPMREAHAVARDAIFGDFFEALKRAP